MIGALSFGAPLVLFGLLALPAIWWLLRLTPPRPQTETFPPLAILARILKREETPSKSPWWLTLLRLILAALVIFALAAPVLNPREAALSGSGPVAFLIDNGWASGADWPRRQAAAETLIREAGDAGRPVALTFTAEGAGDNATPAEAATALERLRATDARPIPTDRAAAIDRLKTGLAGNAPGTLTLLTDGLGGAGTDRSLAGLRDLAPASTILFRPPVDRVVGLTNVDNATDALVATAIRPSGSTGGPLYRVRAFDEQDREIGGADLTFKEGEATGTARFAIPVELRNDIARLAVDGEASAAGVRLVDDSFRRRRVALVSGEAADAAQPLLSPLYYISRALEPFADLLRAENADLAVAIPNLVKQRPSMIVLADIGVVPKPAEDALRDFVQKGGYLVRFAGPRLAATTGEDPLVPVRLRAGERQLGGSLTWSEPQHIAPIPPASPLAGIAIPPDVTVTRQILAEPSVDLNDRTWVSLQDGTPLVTASKLGEGTIVLFHITAEATWSNLPISGSFVDMLRRAVTLSRASGPATAAVSGTSAGRAPAAASLPPFRLMNARGELGSPGPDAQPLAIAADAQAELKRENPPGLYGRQEGYTALNLLKPDAALEPLRDADVPVPFTPRAYDNGDQTDLAPFAFALALALFALDALALLWLNGVFRRLRPRRAAAAAAILVGALAVSSLAMPRAEAQEPPTAQGDVAADAIAATEKTHLAYVETGNSSTDDTSRRGLAGLSQFIASKTALEPGDPVGLDIGKDELAFYPIIYWPIDAADPMPAASAISRVDAYMKNGGTVLFDVHDDEMSSLNSNAVTPGQRRLRDILADLDIPPLEPVPSDHVLTKSFYIMNDFPGRHRGSELWVESTVRDPNAQARPANAGDGVSSIMITSNDLAGAWAIDDGGLFLYPTDDSDPDQREYAYRAGVNIVMYVLTGNYKADQVHVPALLERLGQ
ncbi:DUF4159 domain-containing protein [Aureimonas leprariae]|uniref:DUF4159 domain-containing protein n=1 Tax=Plantimonas leprariae TaxID=2615207 RepID=A0A7V7TWH3_9HYPH|nr:DUF4159 domain-containing protein [Aureimonas leprariae]KAB0679830.1 DUF4159 domain-containing protein [Aureimonas leprariae]